MSERNNVVSSNATVSRLPVYLRYLRERKAVGDKTVSSTDIANALRLNSIQVRKDLALVSGTPGRPRVGFDLQELTFALERVLGCDSVSKAVIVGVGGLGKTLLSYEGFGAYGLKICAAFDTSRAVVGSNVNGVDVHDISDLSAVVRKSGASMGIITVPKSAAQEVADLMVLCGIRAIWNFAPVQLTAPDGVVVQNEDLAARLAVLSKKLNDLLK